ncbi:MAG: M20/M25/M40 family metallo-hydrolase [Desulfurococcales archaeon]|nr:M20/M25/M40 family metallo-hydrolase [Desulfurococcales archaeon]
MDARVDKILAYVKGERDRLVEEVRKLLRMPSVSATGEGIEDTASYLAEWIRERLGGQATLLRYSGHPIVYGRVKGSGEARVVFYNMYDVQPPEPLEYWDSPPFEARIVGDRIIARGAYNTKAGLMSMLLGLEAYQKLYGDLPVTVTIVFEGEEELGSPSMPRFVEDKGGELKGSEMVYFAFPSERVPGKPAIVLGNKGIVFLELRSRVSKYDVHSSFSRGLYNPAAVLARIISHLIDPLEGPRLPWLEEKTVTPTEEDLRYLEDIMEAYPAEDLLELYGVHRPRLGGREWYIAVYFKPTVNVDGFQSGHTGPGTKTITPAEAVAKIDFRLVPNIEPEDVIEGVKELIRRLGLEGLVEVGVHDAYTWSKTSPRSKAVERARRAYQAMGVRPYIVPMIPGSAPSYLFTRKLGIPMIDTAPGHGGRAHAPNEYITVESIPSMTAYTAILVDTFMED